MANRVCQEGIDVRLREVQSARAGMALAILMKNHSRAQSDQFFCEVPGGRILLDREVIDFCILVPNQSERVILWT